MVRTAAIASLLALMAASACEMSEDADAAADLGLDPAAQEAFASLAGLYVAGPSCDEATGESWILEPGLIRTDSSTCVLDGYSANDPDLEVAGACVSEGESQRRGFRFTSLDGGIILLRGRFEDTLLRPCI